MNAFGRLAGQAGAGDRGAALQGACVSGARTAAGPQPATISAPSRRASGAGGTAQAEALGEKKGETA
jgi:hypothetical protein